eukprot:scpid70765/ scgid34409/ 
MYDTGPWDNAARVPSARSPATAGTEPGDNAAHVPSTGSPRALIGSGKQELHEWLGRSDRCSQFYRRGVLENRDSQTTKSQVEHHPPAGPAIGTRSASSRPQSTVQARTVSSVGDKPRSQPSLW